MRFRLTSFISAVLFLGPAASVDIGFYQGANCAAGGQVFTRFPNAAPFTCYAVAAVGALSVLISDLPHDARAQAYSEFRTCDGFVAGNSIAGTVCLAGNAIIQTANWFPTVPPGRVRPRMPEADPETRFSVTYEQPDGVSRQIEVQDGHVGRALELVKAEDYNALAEYPTVSLDHSSRGFNEETDTDIVMLHS